jgi:hypothetical protein
LILDRDTIHTYVIEDAASGYSNISTFNPCDPIIMKSTEIFGNIEKYEERYATGEVKLTTIPVEIFEELKIPFGENVNP